MGLMLAWVELIWIELGLVRGNSPSSNRWNVLGSGRRFNFNTSIAGSGAWSLHASLQSNVTSGNGPCWIPKDHISFLLTLSGEYAVLRSLSLTRHIGIVDSGDKSTTRLGVSRLGRVVNRSLLSSGISRLCDATCEWVERNLSGGLCWQLECQGFLAFAPMFKEGLRGLCWLFLGSLIAELAGGNSSSKELWLDWPRAILGDKNSTFSLELMFDKGDYRTQFRHRRKIYQEIWIWILQALCWEIRFTSDSLERLNEHSKKAGSSEWWLQSTRSR